MIGQKTMNVSDGAIVGVSGAAWIGYLPDIILLFTAVWVVIRAFQGVIGIYESRTVQKWLGRDPRTRKDDK